MYTIHVLLSSDDDTCEYSVNCELSSDDEL